MITNVFILLTEGKHWLGHNLEVYLQRHRSRRFRLFPARSLVPTLWRDLAPRISSGRYMLPHPRRQLFSCGHHIPKLPCSQLLSRSASTDELRSSCDPSMCLIGWRLLPVPLQSWPGRHLDVAERCCPRSRQTVKSARCRTQRRSVPMLRARSGNLFLA